MFSKFILYKRSLRLKNFCFRYMFNFTRTLSKPYDKKRVRKKNNFFSQKLNQVKNFFTAV